MYRPPSTSSYSETEALGDRATEKNRFSYALLEKLLVYLDRAALEMRVNKPSQSYTRRAAFRQPNQDVKFFSKVNTNTTVKTY